MKKALQFFTLFILVSGICACEKEVTSSSLREEQVASMLTGTGNKVWRLKSVKINNVQQVLTTSQEKYTKAYNMATPNTMQGKFTDSDNYYGDWIVKGAAALQEVFQQIGGTGYGYRDYTIISVTDNSLNVYYVQNNAKVEEVYNAY